MATSPVNFVTRALILSSFRSLPFPSKIIFSAWALFPRDLRAKQIYKITWGDSRAAVVLITGYKDCGKEDCECCMMVMELLDDEAVQKYVKSKEFREGEIKVETAMCDNFKGWGNFTINELGILSNVCHPHAAVKCILRVNLSAMLTFGHGRYCGRQPFACQVLSGRQSVR